MLALYNQASISDIPVNFIKPNRIGFVIATLMLLAGCAGPTVTRLADGSVVYRIGCEGTAEGLNYCFGKAGKSCGADGFTIVDENGETITTSDVTDSGNEALVRLWARDQNSILVKCGV